MYEYKTTLVGPVKSLRGRRVQEVSGDLASAYDETLAHYSKQGWRLHSVVPIDRPLVLLVFEREIHESSASLWTDELPVDYNTSGGHSE